MAKLGSGVDELEFDILQGPAAVMHQEGLGVRGRGEPDVRSSPTASRHPQSTPGRSHSPSSCQNTSLFAPPSPPCSKQGPPTLPRPMGLRLPTHHRGADLPQRDDPLLGARDATLQHDKVVVDFPIVREATLREGGSGCRPLQGAAASLAPGQHPGSLIRAASEPHSESFLTSFHNLHFSEGETETQGCGVPCSGPCSCTILQLGFEPRWPECKATVAASVPHTP